MTDQDFDVDLTNCDREPIHELGTIQPIGFLLALSPDWLVMRASANVDAYLDERAEAVLGAHVSDYVADAALHDLRNRLTLLRGDDAVERLFRISLLKADPARLFDVAVHMSGRAIVIEAEPSAGEPTRDTASVIRAMMSRLDQADDLAGFYREGARQVRGLTGFDRVMVYKFDAGGAGTVVAEAVRSGIGSFMGLNYPASDIPQQARKLYLRTPFRIIADVAARPVPIVPARDETGAPLDLSLSVLRAVSPIHIEYLTNMGVGASLSISIIVEGKLWGLFACHHYAARCPDFERRSIAELFGQMFAFKLESRERRELAHYERTARAVSDRLLATVAGDAAMLSNTAWLGETLGQAIPCDGVGVWVEGRTAHAGITPPVAAFPVIVRRLNAMASGRVFATDHLSGLIEQAADYADVGAGLLAIPISRTPRDYVLLFRQERVRTVTWGGDPHKPAHFGPNGARLSPRKSFEAWTEEVRGRSLPFTESELRVAEMLRASLIEVVLRLSDSAQEERRRASERQELLIAELNHRVRNILGLIRGLVRQSKNSTETMADYVRLLEGRIESLARAHDQITQDNWAPAPLRRLIDTEVATYLAEQRDRVTTEGPAVLLAPQAFTTLALVLHELVTNSAKYGALSDRGRVTIAWRLDDEGDLRLDWSERGGPAVQAPTRQGFGTTIIQRSIPYDLGGKAEVDYALLGLKAHFCIPGRFVSLEAGDAVEAPAAAPVATPERSALKEALAGGVLLVEDSLIIAMDAEDILVALGAPRVAIASTVDAALAEIARGEIGLAVLDVSLGNETSLPIAEALHDRGIPFVFATGYGEQLRLPDELAETPIVQKPYTQDSIARGLEALVRPR